MRTESFSRKRCDNRFALSLLLSNLIDDLRPSLRGFADMLSCEITEPREFRRVVNNIRVYAEHALMDDIPFYAAIRQVAALCEKYPSWGAHSSKERRETARVKFLKAELRCKLVNKKLRFYREHPQRMPVHVRRVINAAVDLAHKALGPCEVDWGDCCFGPGVTASTSRSLHEKLVNCSATAGAWQYARLVLPLFFPRWVEHLRNVGTCTFVKGDRITFVPKSSQTDRTIGVQSSLQVFLQKAVEAAFDLPLRRLGVTLADQGRNRMVLNRWEEISTIDLSSASDMVSLEVARTFLPPDWFAVCFGLSSRFYSFDKKGKEDTAKEYHMYHKLSAMGNCTTFPVETLIFACIAQAATVYCGGDVQLCRTYGDDIIVPQNAALLVLEVLNWLGFRANPEKTFVHGPFRESCGRDTLWGVDVRPVYCKVEPRGDTDLYGLHNRLLANQFGFPLDRTLMYIRSLVAKPFWGPAFFGAGIRDLIPVSDGLLSDWYAGKAALVDGFFWSPHPPHQAVSVSHEATTTQWWWLEYRSNIRRFAPSECETTDYLAFLLGIRGGLECTDVKIGCVHTLFAGVWAWPFTSAAPDPKTRPASNRILRKITAGVIWNC